MKAILIRVPGAVLLPLARAHGRAEKAGNVAPFLLLCLLGRCLRCDNQAAMFTEKG
ncbi:hypothetical protein [Janthinobacterium lividum]|uniref:Uncharacterized protein n=1 Tax=Janthinobacterium lividum TaxID=29581 RepID=A0ABU0XTH5_9BURK|nr:hypothetical protein [Janthinobacterium lividum]MDQ4626825.1 hypothetical protein [Janthinobacterium lividum]MDQ4674208.1 hypothetical protein [Janthinobacterium lividum]MDQ4684938.1 hypothetical protein [Janthinobacterium lividum]